MVTNSARVKVASGLNVPSGKPFIYPFCCIMEIDSPFSVLISTSEKPTAAVVVTPSRKQPIKTIMQNKHLCNFIFLLLCHSTHNNSRGNAFTFHRSLFIKQR